MYFRLIQYYPKPKPKPRACLAYLSLNQGESRICVELLIIFICNLINAQAQYKKYEGVRDTVYQK